MRNSDDDTTRRTGSRSRRVSPLPTPSSSSSPHRPSSSSVRMSVRAATPSASASASHVHYAASAATSAAAESVGTAFATFRRTSPAPSFHAPSPPPAPVPPPAHVPPPLFQSMSVPVRASVSVSRSPRLSPRASSRPVSPRATLVVAGSGGGGSGSGTDALSSPPRFSPPLALSASASLDNVPAPPTASVAPAVRISTSPAVGHRASSPRTHRASSPRHRTLRVIPRSPSSPVTAHAAMRSSRSLSPAPSPAGTPRASVLLAFPDASRSSHSSSSQVLSGGRSESRKVSSGASPRGLELLQDPLHDFASPHFQRSSAGRKLKMKRVGSSPASPTTARSRNSSPSQRTHHAASLSPPSGQREVLTMLASPAAPLPRVPTAPASSSPVREHSVRSEDDPPTYSPPGTPRRLRCGKPPTFAAPGTPQPRAALQAAGSSEFMRHNKTLPEIRFASPRSLDVRRVDSPTSNPRPPLTFIPPFATNLPARSSTLIPQHPPPHSQHGVPSLRGEHHRVGSGPASSWSAPPSRNGTVFSTSPLSLIPPGALFMNKPPGGGGGAVERSHDNELASPSPRLEILSSPKGSVDVVCERQEDLKIDPFTSESAPMVEGASTQAQAAESLSPPNHPAPLPPTLPPTPVALSNAPPNVEHNDGGKQAVPDSPKEVPHALSDDESDDDSSDFATPNPPGELHYSVSPPPELDSIPPASISPLARAVVSVFARDNASDKARGANAKDAEQRRAKQLAQLSQAYSKQLALEQRSHEFSSLFQFWESIGLRRKRPSGVPAWFRQRRRRASHAAIDDPALSKKGAYLGERAATKGADAGDGLPPAPPPLMRRRSSLPTLRRLSNTATRATLRQAAAVHRKQQPTTPAPPATPTTVVIEPAAGDVTPSRGRTKHRTTKQKPDTSPSRPLPPPPATAPAPTPARLATFHRPPRPTVAPPDPPTQAQAHTQGDSTDTISPLKLPVSPYAPLFPVAPRPSLTRRTSSSRRLVRSMSPTRSNTATTATESSPRRDHRRSVTRLPTLFYDPHKTHTRMESLNLPPDDLSSDTPVSRRNTLSYSSAWPPSISLSKGFLDEQRVDMYSSSDFETDHGVVLAQQHNAQTVPPPNVPKRPKPPRQKIDPLSPTFTDKSTSSSSRNARNGVKRRAKKTVMSPSGNKREAVIRAFSAPSTSDESDRPQSRPVSFSDLDVPLNDEPISLAGFLQRESKGGVQQTHTIVPAGDIGADWFAPVGDAAERRSFDFQRDARPATRTFELLAHEEAMLLAHGGNVAAAQRQSSCAPLAARTRARFSLVMPQLVNFADLPEYEALSIQKRMLKNLPLRLADGRFALPPPPPSNSHPRSGTYPLPPPPPHLPSGHEEDVMPFPPPFAHFKQAPSSTSSKHGAQQSSPRSLSHPARNVSAQTPFVPHPGTIAEEYNASGNASTPHEVQHASAPSRRSLSFSRQLPHRALVATPVPTGPPVSFGRRVPTGGGLGGGGRVRSYSADTFSTEGPATMDDDDSDDERLGGHGAAAPGVRVGKLRSKSPRRNSSSLLLEPPSYKYRGAPAAPVSYRQHQQSGPRSRKHTQPRSSVNSWRSDSGSRASVDSRVTLHHHKRPVGAARNSRDYDQGFGGAPRQPAPSSVRPPSSYHRPQQQQQHQHQHQHQRTPSSEQRRQPSATTVPAHPRSLGRRPSNIRRARTPSPTSMTSRPKHHTFAGESPGSSYSSGRGRVSSASNDSRSYSQYSSSQYSSSSSHAMAGAPTMYMTQARAAHGAVEPAATAQYHHQRGSSQSTRNYSQSHLSMTSFWQRGHAPSAASNASSSFGDFAFGSFRNIPHLLATRSSQELIGGAQFPHAYEALTETPVPQQDADKIGAMPGARTPDFTMAELVVSRSDADFVRLVQLIQEGDAESVCAQIPEIGSVMEYYGESEQRLPLHTIRDALVERMSDPDINQAVDFMKENHQHQHKKREMQLKSGAPDKALPPLPSSGVTLTVTLPGGRTKTSSLGASGDRRSSGKRGGSGGGGGGSSGGDGKRSSFGAVAATSKTSKNHWLRMRSRGHELLVALFASLKPCVDSHVFFKSVLDSKLVKGAEFQVPSDFNVFHPFRAGLPKITKVKCKLIFQSNAKPALLELHHENPDAIQSAEGMSRKALMTLGTDAAQLSEEHSVPSPHLVILKFDDDLRQDVACQASFRLMNSLWKRAKLRAHDMLIEAKVYKCLSFGEEVGLVEVVPNCNSLNDFSVTDLRRDKQLIRLVTSAAGAYIACYVLGIRDRHSDNILIDENGSLFHIDFGYILGKGVAFDTHPFAIPTKLKVAMGFKWELFVVLSLKAYQVLRDSYDMLLESISLLFLGIISRDEIESYLRSSLQMDLDDKKASDEIRRLLNVAPQSKRTKFKNTMHKIATKNFN